MTELTQSDAELVYKHLPEGLRNDVEAEAYDRVLDTFEQVDALEGAADDPESSFSWGGMTYEFTGERRDTRELTPLTGVEPDAEPEVYDTAHEFGRRVIEAIHEQVRGMQAATAFSPRDFVALVVGRDLGERGAAIQMNVTVGNYRGKQGNISNTIKEAAATLDIVDAIRDE